MAARCCTVGAPREGSVSAWISARLRSGCVWPAPHLLRSSCGEVMSVNTETQVRPEFQQQVGLPVPNYSFSPVERIRKRKEYLACYRFGNRYSSPNFIYYIRIRTPDGEGLRLGTTVTKKVGKAVVRSRLKRLIKEVFRLNQSELHRDADIVVVAKKNIHADQMNYWLAERELMQTLYRALKPRHK